jgi:hypothetical protein
MSELRSVSNLLVKVDQVRLIHELRGRCILELRFETVRKGVRATRRAWIWAAYGDYNAVREARKATIADPSESFRTVSRRHSRNIAADLLPRNGRRNVQATSFR